MRGSSNLVRPSPLLREGLLATLAMKRYKSYIALSLSVVGGRAKANKQKHNVKIVFGVSQRIEIDKMNELFMLPMGPVRKPLP